MSVWTLRDTTYLGATRPHYFADLGSGIIATVTSDPETGGNIIWHVANGLGGFLASNTADSVESAQRAAEAAAKPYTSKPGRKPLGVSPMNNTERNKYRIACLMARATAAVEATGLLVSLHRDLVVAGEQEWAGRAAAILRTTALTAVAEYTRRNADLFVTNGPRLPSADERTERKQRILSLADKVGELASVTDSPIRYGQFEEVLTDLHKAGFFPENSLVSAVAQGFFLSA